MENSHGIHQWAENKNTVHVNTEIEGDNNLLKLEWWLLILQLQLRDYIIITFGTN